MTLTRVSMKEIIDSLSPLVDRPVIDKTGLTGAFNGELHWTSDDEHPHRTARTSRPLLMLAPLYLQPFRSSGV